MAMQRILLVLIAAAAARGAAAQSTIVARMSNVRNDKGVCRVCLFDKAAAFKGESGSPVQCQQVPVSGGAAEATFTGLPPGSYAVFVFHDANNNNKMDKNFLGIPKEGYGASRNNLPFAAAPTFDGNKITITDKTITTVRMRLRNL
ncbi:DUF2141 domain-containing protein [Flaviaesturariibacter amylovorans]|uniref:DUF2141 domain-containing protein n=1 Tax=Flaviaesturariibacter amylovorans TaxID=1084520 RepID=A0ABP8GAL5_9BACT